MDVDWVEDCEEGWMLIAFFNMCGGLRVRLGNGEGCEIGAEMREVVAED